MTAEWVLLIILTAGLGVLCLALAVYVAALAYDIYSEARKK